MKVALTSVSDHTQVWSDDLHVYPVLLVSNDYGPPKASSPISLLPPLTRAVTRTHFSLRHKGIICQRRVTG